MLLNAFIYDILTKRIYFRSLQSTNIKVVEFDKFNFDCTAKPMMIDVNTTQKGDISEEFIPYDLELNIELIKKSYLDVGNHVPESILTKLAEWPEDNKCVEIK